MFVLESHVSYVVWQRSGHQLDFLHLYYVRSRSEWKLIAVGYEGLPINSQSHVNQREIKNEQMAEKRLKNKHYCPVFGILSKEGFPPHTSAQSSQTIKVVQLRYLDLTAANLASVP